MIQFRPQENPDRTLVFRRARSIGKVISNNLDENPNHFETTDRFTGRILEVEAEFRNLGDSQ